MTYLVLGAGGHGRVVADLARVTGATVAGFADADATRVGASVDGIGRVEIAEAALYERLRDGTPLPGAATHVLLGIGDNRARLAHADRLDGRCAPTLTHPRATVSASVSLGTGTVVLAGAVINACARAGRAVIVNTAAVVEHDCVLHDGAHVSPGAVLAGGAVVGALAWVGAGAVVLPGVRVGERAVVGAGAVVTKDVPDDAVAVGVPARVVRRQRPSPA